MNRLLGQNKKLLGRDDIGRNGLQASHPPSPEGMDPRLHLPGAQRQWDRASAKRRPTSLVWQVKRRPPPSALPETASSSTSGAAPPPSPRRLVTRRAASISAPPGSLATPVTSSSSTPDNSALLLLALQLDAAATALSPSRHGRQPGDSVLLLLIHSNAGSRPAMQQQVSPPRRGLKRRGPVFPLVNMTAQSLPQLHLSGRRPLPQRGRRGDAPSLGAAGKAARPGAPSP